MLAFPLSSPGRTCFFHVSRGACLCPPWRPCPPDQAPSVAARPAPPPSAPLSTSPPFEHVAQIYFLASSIISSFPDPALWEPFPGVVCWNGTELTYLLGR